MGNARELETRVMKSRINENLLETQLKAPRGGEARSNSREWSGERLFSIEKHHHSPSSLSCCKRKRRKDEEGDCHLRRSGILLKNSGESLPYRNAGGRRRH